jgi:hypothetical protein
MARTISVAKTLDGATATTKYTLYKIPAKQTGLWTVQYIISTEGNETPHVFWYDASTNNEYLVVAGKNLGVGESILLDGDAVVALQEFDEIRIQNSGTTNAVTYIATLHLQFADAVQFHGNGN